MMKPQKKTPLPRTVGRRRKNRKDGSMCGHCITARERVELIKVLWEFSREPEWAHWEISWRVRRGATLEEARDEVFSLYERYAEDALHGSCSQGDPVELMAATFPELKRSDVVAAVRWYARESRRLGHNKRSRRLLMEASLAATSGIPRYRPPARRGEGAAKRTKKPSARGRTPHPQARRSTPRATPRATRTAAKAGDDNCGDGDSDGPGEPPRPSHKGRAIPLAPVQARLILLTHKPNSLSLSRTPHPCYWCMERRWAA